MYNRLVDPHTEMSNSDIADVHHLYLFNT